MTEKQNAFFASLYDRYFQKLLWYAARITGDDQTAQDMVQEAFLTAALKIEMLSGHPNPGGWLFKSLHYIARREMARAHWQVEVPLETEYPDLQDMLVRLEDVLPSALDAETRELLILRFEKQWEYAQIAEYKGITQAACRQRLSRAAQQLKTFLENEKSCHKIRSTTDI